MTEGLPLLKIRTAARGPGCFLDGVSHPFHHYDSWHLLSFIDSPSGRLKVAMTAARVLTRLPREAENLRIAADGQPNRPPRPAFADEPLT